MTKITKSKLTAHLLTNYIRSQANEVSLYCNLDCLFIQLYYIFHHKPQFQHRPTVKVCFVNVPKSWTLTKLQCVCIIEEAIVIESAEQDPNMQVSEIKIKTLKHLKSVHNYSLYYTVK